MKEDTFTQIKKTIQEVCISWFDYIIKF